MNRHFVTPMKSAIVAVLTMATSTASADPCVICIGHLPFGGCIAERRIRDNPLPAPPQPNIPDIITACRQNIRQCTDEAVRQIPHAEIARMCVADLANCPQNVIKSIPAEVAGPLLYQYISDLRSQASGRWKALPDSFVGSFEDEFPEIDLREVRFATGINTRHGQAITIDREIFFPEAIDLNTRSDIELMLHELQHVVQYRRKGGQQPFLSEYLLHGAGKIIENRSFSIHDEIGTEREAISEAADIIGRWGWGMKLTNKCNTEVRFAVRYRDTDGDWITKGWYNVAPEKSIRPTSGGFRLHSTNRGIYFTGESVDGEHTWGSGNAFLVGDEQHQFSWQEFDAGAEYFEIALGCRG